MKFTTAFLVLLYSTLSVASEFIPEASGVAQVGGTTIICGDEEPKALWGHVDGQSTKMRVKGAEWDDMEDLAALDGERFFGITSHGLTKKGKRDPLREQLLLFRLGSKIIAEASWNLRDEIVAFLGERLAGELDMEAVEWAGPDEGGLDLEGLAYAEGQLYLGLRSPLARNGDALVLVVSNPTVMPRVSGFLRAKLGGAGIRGLEARAGRLLALAGDRHFGLFELDLLTRVVRPLAWPGFERLKKPEGVAVVDGGLLFVQDFKQDDRRDVLVWLPRR